MSEEYRDALEKIIMDHENRISRLEERFNILSEKIDSIDQKLDLVIRIVSTNNSTQKYIVIVLIIILSFTAAVLGIGWMPP